MGLYDSMLGGMQDVAGPAMEANPFAQAAGIAGEQFFRPAQDVGMAAAQLAQFRLPTTTTGFGTSGMRDGQVFAELSPELQQQYQSLLGQSTGLFGEMGSFNPEQSANEQFQRIEEMLAPMRERERQSQESRLLAQGRLGSTGGALEQEARQTAVEQQRRSAAVQSYQEALQRQQAMQQMGLGALGAATSLQQLPLQSLQAGLGVGQAQAGAGARQGAFLLEPALAKAQAQAEGAQFLTQDFTDFMGSMFGGGGMFGG